MFLTLNARNARKESVIDKASKRVKRPRRSFTPEFKAEAGFRTAVLHETHETAASQWICRAPARDVGKAKSYQYQFLSIGIDTFRSRIYNRHMTKTYSVVLTPNQVHFQVEKFWFTGTSFL